jgi:hypothetical protein
MGSNEFVIIEEKANSDESACMPHLTGMGGDRGGGGGGGGGPLCLQLQKG